MIAYIIVTMIIKLVAIIATIAENRKKGFISIVDAICISLWSALFIWGLTLVI